MSQNHRAYKNMHVNTHGASFTCFVYVRVRVIVPLKICGVYGKKVSGLFVVAMIHQAIRLVRVCCWCGVVLVGGVQRPTHAPRSIIRPSEISENAAGLANVLGLALRLEFLAPRARDAPRGLQDGLRLGRLLLSNGMYMRVGE